MDKDSLSGLLRQIPSVDHLLMQPLIADLVARTSHGFVVSEIQTFLAEIRNSIRAGNAGSGVTSDPAALVSGLMQRIKARLRPSLRTVINATGVIIHTNLGRAPLSNAAQQSLSASGACYSNLEYDLQTGQRSHRDQVLESTLQELLCCEAVTVVNNNAAALLLALNTLAFGREVLVSRGELVEIGGSFRIPEILAKSGAVLREVGTTNKTRVQDYEAAIGPDTAMLLRVHPSNFRIQGFTHRPELAELLELARARRIPLMEDIGSGCLIDLRPYGIADEPMAQESLALGVDLVCFSADKLLGGPQGGILAGARNWIETIRRNPLMRTYRVGKLIYAALDATLISYRSGRAMSEIPVLHLISTPFEELERRRRRFLRRLKPKLLEGTRIEQVQGESVVGGGSCPESRLPSPLIAVTSERCSVSQMESRLRAHDPPIIIRLEEDKALVDLRTVFPSQESILSDGLISALS
jgi:L-seryl-tRNA(Ser) seleniumtransferase